MRPAFALLVLLLHLLPVSAGKMVTVERFRLEKYDWDETDTIYVWDFSKSSISDEGHTTRYLSYGDSVFVTFTDRMMFKYALRGDSLMWTGYESRQTKMDGDMASNAVIARVPLPAGVTVQGSPDYSATFTYDLNSNPTRVIRKGLAVKAATGTGTLWAFGTVDDLWIELNGNRPEFVDDTAQPVVYEDAPGYHESSFETDEFDWDANGNMTVNRNKGISDIVYNVLNLPTRIEFDDEHRELRYYASDGTRLRTIYQTAVTAVSSSATAYTSYRTTSVRDYCADVIYLNDSLERVMIPSGYITPQGDYRFHILDHQGNVRVTADASGNVLERNDYYPYGGLFGETGDVQPLKYSRKELERENGLNLYDFHARLFDYAIPAFSSQEYYTSLYHLQNFLKIIFATRLYCAGIVLNIGEKPSK